MKINDFENGKILKLRPRGSAVGQKLDGERDNGAHNGQT